MHTANKQLTNVNIAGSKILAHLPCGMENFSDVHRVKIVTSSTAHGTFQWGSLGENICQFRKSWNILDQRSVRMCCVQHYITQDMILRIWEKNGH